MTRTIFLHILLIGVLILLSCAILFSAAFYLGERMESMQILRAEAQRIRDAMALTDPMAALRAMESGERITWIAPDGTVWYDSLADDASLDNHLDRPEVREALEQGTGEDSRRSVSLAIPMDYWALALEDGSVLRMAERQLTLGSLLQMVIRPLILITVATLVLCSFLALRLARRIVAPINAIDPDQPDASPVYPELEPLMDHLRAQSATIRTQLGALRDRQREFDALTENMREGFLLVGAEGTVLSGNRSARALLGLDRSESRSVFDAPECTGEIQTLVRRALDGTPGQTLLKRSGRTWQLSANPVTAGGTLGAALVLTDVTEREERETLRREFSANVSHELKTPLTSISGFAELMKEGLVPQEKMQEFSADIYRESRRMIDLIDDIIQLSRLDETGGDLPFEQVELYGLCTSVIERLSPAAEAARVMFRQAGQKAVIRGVRQLLEALVYNLCDNAIKYNRPGGSVTVSVWTLDGRCTLSVADTGIGISPEHHERVFERFYRVDKSHSRKIGGTGLGLSIVKHTAQIHGAQLELKSEPGRGTVISVTFEPEQSES